MKTEELSYILREELTAFSLGQEKTSVVTVFENLKPYIIDIFQAHLNKSDSYSEELFVLLENYQTNLKTQAQDLVPIHLFALIIFDRLEREALQRGDVKLQRIWSDVAGRIIVVSLQVNEC